MTKQEKKNLYWHWNHLIVRGLSEEERIKRLTELYKVSEETIQKVLSEFRSKKIN
jgi:DeoR/GlpR family transcriptional regulator of sugar metabolism